MRPHSTTPPVATLGRKRSGVGESPPPPLSPTSASDTFSSGTPRSGASSAGKQRRKIAIRHGDTDTSLFRSQLQEGQMFKVVIDGDDGGVAMRQVFQRIDQVVGLRPKYRTDNAGKGSNTFTRPNPRSNISTVNGVYQISDHSVVSYYTLQPWSVFATDVEVLRLAIGHTVCSRACAHRLDIMQERSRMFFLLNSDMEEKQHYRKSGGSFASTVKVDNSIKVSRAHNAQELLDFVLDCWHRHPDENVGKRDDAVDSSTLSELFSGFQIANPHVLTVEALGWQVRWKGREVGEHSIDRNPISSALRAAFLSFQTAASARLLKKFLARQESLRQATELSIAIFGHKRSELTDIASFLKSNEVGPYPFNMWVLQLRFYDPIGHGETTDCKTMQDQIDNIFLPLIRATLADRDDPKHAALHWLMDQIGAIQLESSSTTPPADFDKKAVPPNVMPYGSNPNEMYICYYVHSNLCVLNSLRRRRRMNPFQLRMSGWGASASSRLFSMMGGFLFGDVVTRASSVREFPVLQYALGMHNVGLTVSPFCDSAHNIIYERHPLPDLLHNCLNVAISTEQPMQYHHSVNPLMEEYGTAQKLLRLTALDVTEIARNSVMMSSFSAETKSHWLGEGYARGTSGNQFELSQVTNVRLEFRDESWNLEKEMFREMFRLTGGGAAAAAGESTGLTRWHFLSTVKDVEYNTVMDTRIRFPRTVLNGPHDQLASASEASPLIARACELRQKYRFERPRPWEARRKANVEADFQRKTATFNEDDWTYAASDAVYIAYPKNALHAWPRNLPTIEEYHRDLIEVKAICDNPVVRDFAHRRLELLEHKFRLHLALNHANEAGMTDQRASSNRDIYQATKVDTHIHMAAGMTPRQMLHFVKKKLRNNHDDIAMQDGKKIVTLGSMMKKCRITENLTVDQLNVQADHTLFERFDNFNNKYNPMENPDLRTLLLKTDNFMNGRYFAEIIHDVFDQYSKDKFTYAENRVSIYGMNLTEWDKLSSWFATHGMSSKHNKWIIQIPRVYKVFRSKQVIGSFGQYLQNIFQPLWDASLHPSEHPTLHYFLNHVSGFDSVDNEATLDLPFETISPWAWTSIENPPYNYYLYYLYANIRTLNEFRASRGFSIFDLRPHCGESGSDEHLVGAHLCADGIGHGVNLKNDPSMQYLYYLSQVGLHVCPLSNNALFLYFLNNPFPDFFRRGLNVSLSTDDPMMFHQTQEPLIEEYSIAARVWGFSQNDLCEIARSSVLQSGFDYDFKREAIGDRWYLSSSLGNDPNRTHLSDIRVAFRFETYHTELTFLEECSKKRMPRVFLTAQQEQEISEMNHLAVPEIITLSTHDQAMEVALRDIDAKREQIRIAKVQLDALRRQQRSLVDNLTEVGLRRQNEKEASDQRAANSERLHYKRVPTDAIRRAMHSGQYVPRELAAAHKLMGSWTPLPPNVLRHTEEAIVSTKGGRQIPQPPDRDRSELDW
ncbi:AMP deaminase, putative [Bodo saltans]|uniref:AMP deaminase n=1 Tax=Bodo saltans TaxID=75058 RepID=A0A0S4J7B1_BODSA|nr:AMP deaminase, putative [Bodo saltans]|eukprot:CUG86083.1 AMP deaminase, putative [Bodo saltans]